MIGIAQVRVLPADLGAQRRELRIRERAEQRDDAAGYPRADDQRRCVDRARHDVRVDEDARTDDAAHHDHGGVERAEAAGEGGGRAHALPPAAIAAGEPQATVAITSLPVPRYSMEEKLTCRAM